MAGLSTGTLHGKLGIRAGNTGIVNLDGEVPVENRVGEEGEGFLIAMSAIDQGRYTVAAGAVGLAQACLDASVKYAHERQTFGQEIGRHQLVKQMIAKMAAGIEMGRLLVWRAGWLKNQGLRNTRETSLAKWHATDHAVAGGARCDPDPRRERLLERVPRGALPAQLQGRRDLRGHEPAPHAHPGRLRPGLSRGPARCAASRGRPRGSSGVEPVRRRDCDGSRARDRSSRRVGTGRTTAARDDERHADDDHRAGCERSQADRLAEDQGAQEHRDDRVDVGVRRDPRQRRDPSSQT